MKTACVYIDSVLSHCSYIKLKPPANGVSQMSVCLLIFLFRSEHVVEICL